MKDIQFLNPEPSLKKELRKAFLEKRRNLSEERRRQAKELLLQDLLPRLSSFSNILSFASKKEEIDLSLLNQILAKEKRLLLPLVANEKTLRPYIVKDLDQELVQHPKWKVKEPNPFLCSEVPLKKIECVLVPALACDINKHRLGYGVGCYDCLLAKLQCPSYGVLFKEQESFSPLPIEAHDKALTAIFFY
ncbi:MAG: 5-formyltetrahydrofolate cyclo-ligase [Simkania negevensis]|nr:5-formyltetrahydrofolate cyclo-ligase [Simkania negevensis]